MSDDQNYFLRYRLLRHEIIVNVNDCLSVESNCNIANEETGDVGLDISLKNVNRTHHLFSIDVLIGDLYLFCQKFALSKEKIYCKLLLRAPLSKTRKYFSLVVINNSMQSASNAELSPNESINIRCILDEREARVVNESGFWNRLKTNLSSFCVRPINELASDVMQMNFASNFLIRSEAKYFPFTQQNITNEDMGNIMNANNQHMTLCINWKASVSDNGKVVRSAFGQHFVQIDQLFDP